MGDPSKKRDESWYWKFRATVEVFKTAIWASLQWVRHFGPFGPL